MTSVQSITGDNRLTEFRRGWPFILIAFIGVSIGISSTFFLSLGVFLKPISAEFGWGRSVVSAIPLLMTLVTAACSPLVGRLVDRFGVIRFAFCAAAAFATALYLLALLSAGPVSFLALVVLLAFLGAGTIPLPYTKLIVSQFDRARGLALGLALSGTGLGAALVSALVGPLVGVQGWRAGYLALAGAIAVALGVMLVLSPLLRRSSRVVPDAAPTQPAQDASGRAASLFGDPVFRRLGAIFFLAACGIMTLVVHLVPILTDSGMSLAAAARIGGLVGLSLIAGRLLTGLLLDVIPARILGALLFSAAAIGIALLLVGGPALAAPAAVLAGFGVGAEVDIMAFLTSRYFPAARYAVVYGGLYALFLLGSALGPALAGIVFDVTGSYGLAIGGASAMLAVSALMLYTLGTISRGSTTSAARTILP